MKKFKFKLSVIKEIEADTVENALIKLFEEAYKIELNKFSNDIRVEKVEQLEDATSTW